MSRVDIDPARVKVAQEYQIVFAVELDEFDKLTAEPERVPGKLNIYDSVPGMERYSRIWQFNYVVVPRDYKPNTLRSEGDCLTSATLSIAARSSRTDPSSSRRSAAGLRAGRGTGSL